MIPVVFFPSIIPLGEDDEDLASIQINEYDGVIFHNVGTEIGKRVVTIDTGKQASKINHSTITAGTSASLELENSNADYQTSGIAKVILIIEGNATTLTDFEIIEDTTANLGTGIPKEDFSSVSLVGSRFITSKELEFAASKYITIKVNTGTVGTVTGYVIE